MSEQFALLPHGEDLGVPREVVDKGHVILCSVVVYVDMKILAEILLVGERLKIRQRNIVRLKTSNMSTRFFFNSAFELLKMCEYFALVAHRINLGVFGDIVNERDVVSASSECGHLCQSLHIRVDYV